MPFLSGRASRGRQNVRHGLPWSNGSRESVDCQGSFQGFDCELHSASRGGRYRRGVLIVRCEGIAELTVVIGSSAKHSKPLECHELELRLGCSVISSKAYLRGFWLENISERSAGCLSWRPPVV